MKKLKKKEKKETVSSLKKKLDDIFSKYIRLRNADENGMVKCFTSDKIMHWKEAHAGHFISRRHLGTRWHPINVQVQSPKENLFNQGNAPEFGKRILEQYGQKHYDELFYQAKNIVKMERWFYEVSIESYTKMVNKLLEKYERLNK